MTVTTQQLIQNAVTLKPDTLVYVVGTSGTDYPIEEIVLEGVLTLRVDDEGDDDEEGSEE
ncbi:hypothetical protein [Anabaena azotica]|uniref:Uncharacterized protein n=1 Tax=Anabaena azotica FACHB-119 TaxID=947527 RepID=A0ABR8D8E1_9NOST|nr:hypothetical protein [Anabaena azotica]MBD2503429.1 hypothetical protein [Anabaena azotica FACHB-119]